MPSVLHARDLSRAFGSRTLFTDVSLRLDDRDRMGLIGPNGAGKSTLLRILAGLDEPDQGAVEHVRGLRLVYVEQEDRFNPDLTPYDAVVDQLTRDEASGRGGDSGRLDPETRAAIALSRIGFDDDDETIVGHRSGGWRKRLSLAVALARDPEVLLLDEPTNHLDYEGVQWLEEFVRGSRIPTIVITHDRRFLEEVATRIVELSPAYPGGSFEVDGNYSEFVRRKEAFLDAQAAAQKALANTVRRDTAWLRQGIQGRQTRNKTQVEDATRRRSELKQVSDRNLAPTKATTIDFAASGRKTRALIELRNVTKSMGNTPLFEDLELLITPGRRIGLLGPNGSGKTTMLRILRGELEPDAGEVRRADDLTVITFSQHREDLDPQATLHESLCPVGDMVETPTGAQHVSGYARRFLFDPTQLKSRINELSGGERARVCIARLMLTQADVLLLDEPTNDLDIPSLEVLEEALLSFPGGLVLVTHDRFMLERIATDFVALDGGGAGRPFASLQQWESWINERTRANGAAAGGKSKGKAGSAPAAKPADDRPTPMVKLSYKLQRELDGMENAILEAETSLEAAERKASDPNLTGDHAKLHAAWTEAETARNTVDRLYLRWSELEAMQRG
ncbi:MAG: ABC-F family ATP-binding cassette domain-containing protein [Phycisphaerales bacterium]